LDLEEKLAVVLACTEGCVTFASVGFHATGCLARLNVSPDHRGHVALVVHESSIKVWCVVRIRRGDVSRTAREGVLQEVKHGEELSGRQQHVVAEPAADDGVMHNWLVGLLLEVAVPT
jgi:hypothetical protein